MMARVHPIISTARAVSRLQIVLESVFSPFGIATLPIVSSRRDEQGLLVTIAGLAFALNLSSLLAGMALLAADREHPPPACAARCALSSSDAFRTYARAMTVGAAGTAIALVSAVVCANRRACHAAGRHHGLLTVLTLAQMGLLAARATAAALAAKAARAFEEGLPPFVGAFDAPGPRADDGLAGHVELTRRRAPASAPPVPPPQPRRVAPAHSPPPRHDGGEDLDDELAAARARVVELEAAHRRRLRPRSPVAVAAATPRTDCSTDEDGSAHTCAVCLEPLSVIPGRTTALPCGHTFCTACIEPWLHEHTMCPTCRHPCA